MLTIEQCQEAHKALALTVGDTDFALSKLTFIDANLLYSFYVDTEAEIVQGKRSFMRSTEFITVILPLMADNINVGGLQISKTPKFWDDNFKIYDELIINALQVFVLPFYESRIELAEKNNQATSQK